MPSIPDTSARTSQKAVSPHRSAALPLHSYVSETDRHKQSHPSGGVRVRAIARLCFRWSQTGLPFIRARSNMEPTEKKLFLLDAMALVYRAHFALIARPIFTSKGVNTSALY